MKYWACKQQAWGYGHTDNRHGVGDPRRYPIGWVLCSRRCQDAFHALYGSQRWARESHIGETEVVIVDPPDIELVAVCHCLKAFGEAAGEIGFTKSLGDYSETEALWVIDAIATCWSDVMIVHHGSSKLPPVRDLPPTPDPLAPNAASPFVDLEGSLPWEEPKGKKS